MTSKAEVARRAAPILARMLARLDDGPAVPVDADVPVVAVAAPPATTGERSSVCVDQDVRAGRSTRPPAARTSTSH